MIRIENWVLDSKVQHDHSGIFHEIENYRCKVCGEAFRDFLGRLNYGALIAKGRKESQ